MLVKIQPKQKLGLTFSVVFFRIQMIYNTLGLLELRKESSSRTELVIICGV